jgi:hypothetical protein
MPMEMRITYQLIILFMVINMDTRTGEKFKKPKLRVYLNRSSMIE